MARRRVKVPAKIKALLQKEINSECPFCNNHDVGSFEIHHIDSTPNNSKEINNLLLLCPTCHTKIEKGDIPFDEVAKKKADLKNKSWKIEFVSVVINSNNCNWEVSPENEFAFFGKEKSESPHPILSFTFINHLSRTAVLKAIDVKTKVLSQGMSGIGTDRTNEPRVLYPLVKYHMQLDYTQAINSLQLTNPIEVPSGKSFLFQVELSVITKGGISSIDERIVTYFSFKFSDGIILNIPTICFNCNDENEQLKIHPLY